MAQASTRQFIKYITIFQNCQLSSGLLAAVTMREAGFDYDHVHNFLFFKKIQLFFFVLVLKSLEPALSRGQLSNG